MTEVIMSKGLGAMLAELATTAEKVRLQGESVACPLCGQEMSFDGSEWVCQHPDACEPVRASVKRSFPDAPDLYQSTLLAAMLEGGQIKVEFRVVRGQNGVDAYRVMAGDGYGDQDWLPEYVRRHEWVWQGWIPGEVAA